MEEAVKSLGLSNLLLQYKMKLATLAGTAEYTIPGVEYKSNQTLRNRRNDLVVLDPVKTLLRQDSRPAKYFTVPGRGPFAGIRQQPPRRPPVPMT
jgi:hypothetical protein